MSKSPKLLAAVLVACVAVALMLGATGSATAGALTKGTVKKIAAKVVKKQAGSLSVAHATTADSATTASNATNLNGKPSTAYQDETIRYSLISTTLSTNKAFTLSGLTPGATYYVHFHLIMGSAPGVPAGNCQIDVPGSATEYAWGYGTTFSNAISWDNGAVVPIPAGGQITINCASATSVSSARPSIWSTKAARAASCTRRSPASMPASTSATSCGQKRISSRKVSANGAAMSANITNPRVAPAGFL
jgi:hypothetical protein